MEEGFVLNRVSPAELVRFYENMELILVLNANLSKDTTLQSYLSEKISDIEQLESNCHNVREIINDNINSDEQNSEDQNQLLKIVKDITSKGFVRNNYNKNLVDLSDVKISLKGKK